MRSTLLSVQDIAKLLGIGKNAAYDLVKQPEFPAIKIGSRIKTTEALLNEWLSQQASRQ